VFVAPLGCQSRSRSIVCTSSGAASGSPQICQVDQLVWSRSLRLSTGWGHTAAQRRWTTFVEWGLSFCIDYFIGTAGAKA
jgi:hypothetical protein